jgi:hypothetical protein
LRKTLKTLGIAALLILSAAPSPASGFSGFFPGAWGYEPGGRQVFYAYAYELPQALTKLEGRFVVEHVIPAIAKTDRIFPNLGCFPSPGGPVICQDNFSFEMTYSTDIVMIVVKERPAPLPTCQPRGVE